MMLMKFLTLLVALLFVSAAQAACQQGCRRDGHFKDAQVYAKMRSTHRYGGILTARIDWTFRHLQTNYEGKISYWANLFEETKTHCSSDGIFCINDRLAMGKEWHFGYTLYYANECSNYWGSFSEITRCPAKKTTTTCHWEQSWGYVTC